MVVLLVEGMTLPVCVPDVHRLQDSVPVMFVATQVGSARQACWHASDVDEVMVLLITLLSREQLVPARVIIAELEVGWIACDVVALNSVTFTPSDICQLCG